MTDEVDENSPAFRAGVAVMDNLPAEQYQKLSQWLEEHKD